MSFEGFFDYIWESEGFFIFFWVILLIFALYLLACVWIKKVRLENSGGTLGAQEAQEAQIKNKEATEEFSFFVITFEIMSTNEEKKMIVREQGADILLIGDKGILYYEGNMFIRFEKIKNNEKTDNLS